MFKYVISAFIVAPGIMSGGFLLKKSNFLDSELQKIKSLEKRYGGCRLWLTSSSDAGTGWYVEKAMQSKTLRDNTQIDKVKRLIEQLSSRYGKTDTQTQTIVEKCGKVGPGKIVELVWEKQYDKGKWSARKDPWKHSYHIEVQD